MLVSRVCVLLPGRLECAVRPGTRVCVCSGWSLGVVAVGLAVHGRGAVAVRAPSHAAGVPRLPVSLWVLVAAVCLLALLNLSIYLSIFD